MIGENVALGNVGGAQLDAGDVDAAIESVRSSVDGLRRISTKLIADDLTRWIPVVNAAGAKTD